MANRPSRRSRLALLRRAGNAWRRVSPFLGASRGKLLGLGASSVGVGLAEAVLLALIAALAASLSEGRGSVALSLGPLETTASTVTLLWIGFALAVVRGGFQILTAYLPAAMSANAMANLRQQLFEAFTRTSWSVQASERDGHFQALMGGHVSSTSKAIVLLGQAMSALLMFLTLVASAFVLSLPTALVLIVTSALLFVLLQPLSRRLRGHAKALSAENVEYSQGMQEVVRMAEEIQVFGPSQEYRDGFHRRIELVRLPLLRTRFLGKLVPVLYQSVALLLLILALAIVAVVGGDQLASLGAVVLILIRSVSYGQQLQSAVTQMDELVPFMDRLRQSLTHYAEHPKQDGAEPLPPVERLGMDTVSFAYQPGDPVLTEVDFEVAAGEAIGVVGPSGAGKSTLVQLLLRLRDPDEGRLHVNGEDARRFRRAEWNRRVAYVPQTPQLIWGTVSENIRFYRPDIPQEAVEQAARRAHIHDEILALPDGYDTVVGERVSAVSGGQRQRLCLARALAGDPDVLILDEPTSALDVKSEMGVQESLRSLKGEMILFLVAHRMSTLSICNRVMVVVDGRLQAIDAPQRLLESNAFYREAIEITRQQSTI
ncbi:ABC transporter ATP-binding protein [Egicoccus halophilus]|uniref:ABC transporter ATP-binding protein n=1 Tax=Egicoccus halophilus TaxID=1670830 RepID=A0A8J3A7H1_9ACTN|nr:ABC transporter ATP-binding protein [Egicoccus halophilus]GGI05484.1 ABC transporter ATP-binding protein [Egicoccus halophilus]